MSGADVVRYLKKNANGLAGIKSIVGRVGYNLQNAINTPAKCLT